MRRAPRAPGNPAVAADPVDACIVGSGAGGGPVALALAKAGMRVVVLEKGPDYRQRDFVHDELNVVRRNFFVPFVADEPHVYRAGAAEAGERTTFGWIACCAGGGTAHWAGYSLRVSPDDLSARTRTGGIAGASLVDWPIGYEELEPYFERAEREIGVSGVAGQSPFEPPRRHDYPLPPLAAHPLARRVDEATVSLGWHPYPVPRALLSQPYRGRRACVYCDLCASYGCEVGAKGSTAAALLPRAVQTGRCEIRCDAMASGVRVDAQGRAAAVAYVDRSGGRHEQAARFVVLACSTIETPRLLLNSATSMHPQGLANASGLVGKNLMLLTRGGGSADFLYGGRAGIEDLADPTPFVGRAVRDHYAAAGTLIFDFAPLSPISAAEKLGAGPGGKAVWGKALKDRLRAHWREGKHLEFEAFAECLPVEANAVDLATDVKDRFGLPAARITFAHHPDDRRRSERLVGRGGELLAAMRPDRTGTPTAAETFDVLQCGTCRFGTDPARSVLDRDCQAHDVPNLYVTDGSFMPTSGAVPNTLTILANAFRVADAIVARAKRRDIP